MTIIVDASALIDLFIGRLGAAAIRGRIEGAQIHAPVTIDAEVLHGLRRQWVAGLISEPLAALAIDALREAEITRHPIHPLVDRIWSLRHNITAYDAGYVALAESLDAPLVTRDARLARSAGHGARIDYIA
jgi:predicted nucleic acid-binding protein